MSDEEIRLRLLELVAPSGETLLALMKVVDASIPWVRGQKTPDECNEAMLKEMPPPRAQEPET